MTNDTTTNSSSTPEAGGDGSELVAKTNAEANAGENTGAASGTKASTGTAADAFGGAFAPAVTPAAQKKIAKDNADPEKAGGVDQVKRTVDLANSQGFYGDKADQTPNEHYTVSGVGEGLPTPETDKAMAEAAGMNTFRHVTE